ncbi:MAG: MFS transporter [Chloroflexi bacterium]|nr:MFS transporter [Chloroflexota bacterium]
MFGQSPVNSFSTAAQILRRDVLGRFKPGIWLISLIGFINVAGISISLPFLALYLYQDRGVSMTLVGVILFLGGLCSAAAQMFGGSLSDRFGRRPILFSAFAISTFLFIVMAVLIGYSAPIWTIAAVYAGARSALVMMRPVMSAMVADLSPSDRLTETFALLRAGQNLGWAAGPAAGGYLAASFTYAWLFGVAALISAIALGLVFLLLRESFDGASRWVKSQGMLSPVRDQRFLVFTGLSLMVFLVIGQMVSTLSVFIVDRAGFSTVHYGLLITVNGLGVALFQYPMARVLGRAARSTALILGSLLYGLGYLSMAGVGDLAIAVAAMAVITAGDLIFLITTLSVVTELSPPNQRGQYMGFYGLSETLGLSFGPLLGGILLDSFPANPLLLWGTIAFVALLAAVGFHRWGLTQRTSQSRRL